MKKHLYPDRYPRAIVYQFLLLVCMIGVSMSGWGQTLISWNASSTTGGSDGTAGNYGTSPWPTSSLNSNLSLSTGFSRGSNVTTSGTSATNAWGGSGGWSSTGGVDADGFYFIFTVNSGYTVSLSSITGSTRRSSAGPTGCNIDYSVGGATYATAGTWSTSSTSATGTAGSVTLSSISTLQNVASGTSIKIRIAPTGSTSGNWYLENTAAVVLNGTVTAVTPSYAITVTQATGGNISPGTTTVASGGSQTFTATPTSCYNFTNWIVDGVNAGSASTYTFSNVTTTHTITAAYTLKTYNITASAGANGSISPSGVTSTACGSSPVYTITPNSCYVIQDVQVDGSSVGAVSSYTFTNVTTTHTISATFVVSSTYAITASAGANGSISPSGTTNVNCGASQSYTITPNSCYNVSNVTVDGASMGAITSYNFSSVSATHTISATFVAITYGITATAGANGSISPSGTTNVTCGTSQAYTITPNSCYSVSNVTVDGVSMGAITSYTFSSVTATHTISATFVINGPYNITATAGTNGSISPSGTTSKTCGSSQAYTITPASCYSVASVTVDGVSMGAITSYTFSNITATHTISATFAINSYNITATAGANGSISPSGTTSTTCGSSPIYTITPNSCYAISSVTVDGTSMGAITSYTFTNVTTTHTISATFASTAASISSQPSSVNVSPGSTAAFSVTASNASTYQWQVNTGSGYNNIIGANSSTYTTAATTLAMNGYTYQVVITGTCGNVTSSAATLTVTSFVYATGDWRSKTNTDLATANSSATATDQWEYYNGTSWGATPGGSSPQNYTYLPTRVIITKTVTGGANNTGQYATIVILSGGSLSLNNNGTPGSNDFIDSGDSLEVQSGGLLTVAGQISINSGASLIVRSGAKMIVSSSSVNNSHAMWDGIENFEPGSTVSITNWKYTGTGTGSLMNIYGTISDNINGYKFGILDVNINPGFSWVLVGGALTLNLCDTLDIANASANPITITSNTGSPSVTLGRINHKSGIFGLSASYSGGATQTVRVTDSITTTGGSLKLFYNGGGTATAINVNLAGSLTVKTGATFSNDATTNTGAVLNFNGTNTTQYLDVAVTATAIPMNINSGAYVALRNQDLTVNSATGLTHTITVLTGGTLDFNYASDNITPLVIKKTTTSAAGINNFATQQGSTLKITSADGIQQASGTLGNVQFTTGNKIFNQLATFWYTGHSNQVTGDAITTSGNGKQIIIDMSDKIYAVTLSQSTGLTNATTISTTGGKLDIRKGQFIETATAYITGSTGTLTMAAGTLYQIPALSTSSTDLIPRMDGSSFAYTLNGGIIEMNGAGSQILRGARTYYNVKYSGSNIYGTNYKNLSSDAVINDTLFVTGANTVVDCIDASSNAVNFTGVGGIVMDGGRLRFKTLSVTCPELTGVNVPFYYTGGTVEFYGTSASASQLIRGTDGNGNTVSYYNVDINATAANISSYNVSPDNSLATTGAFTVYSPAVFQYDETENLSGIGSFEVKAGATLKYGSPNGIKTSGTTTADGNIRITGTRTLPTTASYGFVGNGDMNSGNGLPTQMVNMYIQKTTAGNVVTLTNSAAATGVIAFTQGIVATGTNVLTASNGSTTAITGYDAPNSTGSYSNDKYVIGNMERTISSAAMYDFPVGDVVSGIAYNPIQLNVASGTGNATAKFVAGNPGTITVPHTTIGPCAPNKKNFVRYTGMTGEGWWNFTSSTSTTFGYDVYLHPNLKNLNTKPNESVIVTSTGVSTAYSATYRALKAPSGTGGGTWPATSGTAGDPCTVSSSYYQIIGASYSGFSDFAPGGGDGNTTALPVQLLYLTAQAMDNQYIHLIWATASEIDNRGFEIERSTDGISFETIGWIDGHDNSNTEIVYNSDDKKVVPNTVYYYRLKQIDIDGNSEYTNIVSASILGEKGFVLEALKPNPASNEVTIDVVTENIQPVNVVITDMLGRIVLNQSWQLIAGYNETPLDISGLASGTYSVTVRSENGYFTKKLAITR